jgi:hypothetical protein
LRGVERRVVVVDGCRRKIGGVRLRRDRGGSRLTTVVDEHDAKVARNESEEFWSFAFNGFVEDVLSGNERLESREAEKETLISSLSAREEAEEGKTTDFADSSLGELVDCRMPSDLVLERHQGNRRKMALLLVGLSIIVLLALPFFQQSFSLTCRSSSPFFLRTARLRRRMSGAVRGRTERV